VTHESPPRIGRSVDAERTYDDEISLRELYLILRRATPWIALSTLIVTLAAFLIQERQPESYEASATVTIGASPIRSNNAGSDTFLAFDLEGLVDARSYERIALSDPVIDELLTRVAPLDPNQDLTASRSWLRDALEVESADAPNNQLVMVHTARSENPERAAALANAWTETAIDEVRGTLLATFGGVASDTTTEISARRRALDQAERARETFLANDTLPTLEAREARLTQERTDVAFQLDDIERSIASHTAERTTLLEQRATLEMQTDTSDATSDAYLAGLRLDEALAVVTTQVTVATRDADTARSALEGFDLEHDLASLRARIDGVRTNLTNDQQRQERLERDIATTRAGIDQLEVRLAQEPERITLADTFDGPQVATALQRDATDDALTLVREELNPVHTALARERDTELVRLERLERERSELDASILRQTDMLEREREAWTQLERERAELVRNHDRARIRLDALLERADTLRYATLDERARVRELRPRTPEWTALTSALRDTELTLATLTSERVTLLEQADRYDAELIALRSEMAASITQRNRVERDYQEALTAFDRVANLEPIITFLANLTSTGSRMVTSASVPTAPTGTSSLLVATLAAVVTAMAGILFAFIREAVADPARAFQDAASTSQPHVVSQGASKRVDDGVREGA